MLAPRGNRGCWDLSRSTTRRDQRICDAGLSRNIGPNLQIDVDAARRISSGRPTWFIATGFALRRPLFKR
jgi:hypothetical protein